MHELCARFLPQNVRENESFSVVSRIFIVRKCNKTNPSVSCADSSLYTREPLKVPRNNGKAAHPELF